MLRTMMIFVSILLVGCSTLGETKSDKQEMVDKIYREIQYKDELSHLSLKLEKGIVDQAETLCK
jgi:outer membrane biogenesis lipoprotein LolB